MKDCTESRQAVIDACRWLIEKGFVFGTWGNISLRLEDGNILITPSKIAYDVMTPDDMVVLAPDGKVISGFRLATSERELHRGIMNKRPDVGAIIHAHSPYAMAAAATGEGMPPIAEEICPMIGGSIPITSQFVPSEKHVALGEEVTRSIGDRNAVLIRNHGPVCCGRTLEEAKACVQVVEKAAMMYLMIRGGSMVPVPEPWVAAGRQYFLFGYGKT